LILTKEKMRMKNAEHRIDQSVNLSVENTNMKNSRNINPAVTAEQLKSALVRRLNAEYAEVGPRLVYQAVNEADALASLTSVPLLVLPTLAEEKVRNAAAWTAHQRAVLGEDLMAFAA
jgi:energy-converting hydrogenase Eha subunit E